MTWLLEVLLGRLPIGWLQLKHRKGRFFAGLGGVAFAVVLVFFQTGILTGLDGAVRRPYGFFRAQVVLSGPDVRSLTEGALVPRRRVFDVRATPGVAEAAGLSVGTVSYKSPGQRTLNLTVYGLEPAALARFTPPEVAAQARALEVVDTALLDTKTRGLPPAFLPASASEPPLLPLANMKLAIVGGFEQGPGFENDGSLIVSSSTFGRLFPHRDPAAVNHVLMAVQPDVDPAQLVAQLGARVPASEARAQRFSDLATFASGQQTTDSPVGLLFGFGAMMGIVVGVVLVFQVLSTEVSDHLREYATLKALGHGDGTFVGIVLEQAAILAVCGFVPGALVATLLHGVVGGATGWPMVISFTRFAFVLIGALVASSASGLVAARKLRTADPAELYS
jgi:putative ABC transport system permease protein